jgi:hypothetical protein
MARLIAAALWLVAITAPASAQTIRWAPEAGTHSYRYETTTTVPNAPGNGYRLDYDLVSDGKGGLVAVVTGAWHREGAPEWSDAEIDDDCRTALHAQGKELARVTLSPIALATVANLGPGFMAECAPADIFFPMTDILRLALVQVAPEFGLARLTKPGQSGRYPGYATKLERLDTAIDITSTGGTITFTALVPGRATIEMISDPMKLTLIHRRAYSGADVTLTGTEISGFRIEIDPASGVLLGAASTGDKLDVTMSLPGGYSQPLPVTRETQIALRP